MTASLDRALWPVERVGEALAQLARAAGLPVPAVPVSRAPATVAEDPLALARWISGASQGLGLDAEPLRVWSSDLENVMLDAAPAIVTIADATSVRFAALLGRKGRLVALLAPDGTRVRAPLVDLVDAVRGRVDPELSTRIEDLLRRASVAEARRSRALRSLLGQLTSSRLVDAGWSVGLPPNAPFWTQLRDAGVFSSARITIFMQTVQQGLGLLGWWLVGRGALDGQIAFGWLAAWGLVLMSLIPARAMTTWAQGSGALRFSILLKRRLLYGALHLETEEVRQQGSGELLGRVIESEALESLVTSGGLATLLAVVEVVVAAVVLTWTPGRIAAVVLVGYVALAVLLFHAVGEDLAGWTAARLTMTRNLVERMVGHRTRLAQQPRAQWHEEEDDELTRYALQSTALDRKTSWLEGGFARSWLLAGFVAISPGFVKASLGGTDLAIAIGGVLLGYQALSHMTTGLISLLRARGAWREARPLFEAGARSERLGSPEWSAASTAKQDSVVLEARDLVFRYPTRHEPVLRGASVKVGVGDRLLVEGPSGGGKSTLGAILSGLRTPDAGLLLLGGLDRQTLGEDAWRHRVAAAPQFHENHLVGATLAFNLLMGRSWPPRAGDLKEARDVCQGLGLGPLLEQMPSGIMQMVGETGWQLSHGERSRVYIARTLLQRADVIVLDESFASLDPETLERAMRCVLERAPALIVIAHP